MVVARPKHVLQIQMCRYFYKKPQCIGTNRCRDQSRHHMKQRAGFSFYQNSSIFPIDLWKSYFFLPQTNTSHLSPSVPKSNFWIDQKVSVNCENLLRYRFASGESFSGTKKGRSKTTNQSQLAWPFQLHEKQTPRSIACDWLTFSCSQTCCLPVPTPVFLI